MEDKNDLIARRKALGMTQSDLAAALDMGLRAIQAIEAGESEYRRVHALAVEAIEHRLAGQGTPPSVGVRGPTATARGFEVQLLNVNREPVGPALLYDEEPEARAAAELTRVAVRHARLAQ